MRVLVCGVACLMAALCLAEEFPHPPNTEKSASSPMPPEEVCRTAKLPPGFEMTVFAAEPDVQNPIGIAFDERGRLWVAENYTYSGRMPDWFDTKLRDRILILEDADNDGRHDKRTVFWDKGRKLSSVEVGFGGAFVLCAPHLLFIPDANRDDVPDGEPKVLLDGFAEGPVGHNLVNGLKWGPDGWLYGRHGIQATSLVGPPGSAASQRMKINTGIWRYHPTRKVVEAVMHGMTNSWGFDYDEHGEMFCVNTVIGHLWHVVPGAHVKRMYGVDINPHAYQLIDQSADHLHWDTSGTWSDTGRASDKTDLAGGGHAHSGLMIYQGENWPKEYRGKAYMLNLHGRRINCDRLEREGCSFVAKHEPDFARFADPWFRGIDLITGPDGGVFIADWSDTGECHEHDGVHRTSGRIYKLTYGKSKKMEPVDLRKSSDIELVKLSMLGDVWSRRMATVTLAGRPNEQGQLVHHSLLQNAILMQKASSAQQVRFKLGILSEYSEEVPARFAAEFCELARKDPDGLTCLYVAASLQRMTDVDRWKVALALALRKEFANDRMFPIMLWLGIEPAVPKDPEKAIALAKICLIPLVTENIARRLTLEIDRDPATVEQLLDLAIEGEAAHPSAIIVGMGRALNGWRKAAAPANWKQAAEKFAASETAEVRQFVRELSIVFGDGVAMEQLQAIATDTTADPEARRQALRAVLAGKPDGFAGTLQDLCKDRAVNAEAIRGLAQYVDANTPAKLLGLIDIYSPEARTEMIGTLCARPEYAQALLAAVRDGRIKPGEISAFHARQIRAFDKPELTKSLTELWGDVRVSAAEKQALIESWRSKLTPDALANASLPQGRALFEKSCKNCHVLFGSGRKVGPDLTGSDRKNLDYLLQNILDPSASVGIDFRAVNICLDDGRVVSGVVSQQNDRTITLETDREPITLDRTEIEDMKPTTNSLMPDGLLTTLSEAQVRDLIAYLQSSEQVPLPE